MEFNTRKMLPDFTQEISQGVPYAHFSPRTCSGHWIAQSLVQDKGECCPFLSNRVLKEVHAFNIEGKAGKFCHVFQMFLDQEAHSSFGNAASSRFAEKCENVMTGTSGQNRGYAAQFSNFAWQVQSGYKTREVLSIFPLSFLSKKSIITETWWRFDGWSFRAMSFQQLDGNLIARNSRNIFKCNTGWDGVNLCFLACPDKKRRKARCNVVARS